MSQFTRKFLALASLTLIGLSTAYSQTDSTRCFTIEEQRIIVRRLLERKECLKIQQEMNEMIVEQDSLLKVSDRIIEEERDKARIIDAIYQQEREARIFANTQMEKATRRMRFWRVTAICSGSVTVLLLYLSLR